MAVGPVGRNAEVAGVAALTQVAAIYSYSKTKGLFAGNMFVEAIVKEVQHANCLYLLL